MNESQSERDPLDQLAELFLVRYRAGDCPPLNEYTTQHPELADEIRELFPALVAMERARPNVGGSSEKAGAFSEIPNELGDYRILREIGRGGMGVVYEAIQESLHRHVALKVLPFHSWVKPKHLERFQREAQAAARLHHTNIVPVFGVGESGGIHYYAMQFIRGQGVELVLEEVKRLRRLGRLAVTPSGPRRDHGGEAYPSVAASVAESLLMGQFSGSRNSQEGNQVDKSDIVRSGPPWLKDESPESTPLASSEPGRSHSPSAGSDRSADASRSPGSSDLTTLVESKYYHSVAQIGVQAAEALDYAHGQGVLHRDIKPSNLLLDTAGRVWITDFGLAKIDDSEELTNPGDMVGTLRYMAPERLRGQADPRSDVYSLGVTLYELLTLQPAFQNSSRAALIDRISAEPPKPLRRIDSHIPRDLETMVLKAIAKEPGQRYRSAGELAEDLQRFLADRPIKARRASVIEQAWRWVRRNRLMAGMAALVAGLVLAVVGGIGWVVRDRAARDTALDNQVQGELDEARARIENGEWPEALAEVDRAEKLLNAVNHRELPPRLLELQKDLAFAQRLEDIYSQPKTEEFFIGNEPDTDYVEAFANAGIDVAELSVADAAERMRGRSIRRELARALDFWSYMRQRAKIKRPPDWKQLVEIAEAIDPDPERNPIRQARRNGDRKALEALASSPDFGRLSPETVLLLAVALYDSGGTKQAMDLLRQAHRHHFENWWISSLLGWWCLTGSPPEYEGAIRYYTAAMAVRPRNAYTVRAIGDALAGKGAYKEAVATFCRAIELKPDHWDTWWHRADAYLMLGQWDNALADYSHIINQNPQNVTAWIKRGYENAQRGKWPEAISDYRRAFQIRKPTDPAVWLDFADLLLATGDTKGYRQTCREMLERFGSSKNTDDIAYLAHACVMGPNALPDISQVLKLAEQRASLTPSPSRHYLWSIHVLALGYFRAAQYERAVQHLDANQKTEGSQDLAVLNWLVLALDHAKLHHPDESKKWLHQAQDWVKTNSPDGDRAIPAGWHWRNWLELQSLCREAESLIQSKTDASPPSKSK